MTLEKIKKQKEQIEALNTRRNKLSGKITELEHQLETGLAKLSAEFGVKTIEEAEKKIVAMRAEVKADEEKVDALLAEAEAALE